MLENYYHDNRQQQHSPGRFSISTNHLGKIGDHDDESSSSSSSNRGMQINIPSSAVEEDLLNSLGLFIQFSPLSMYI